MSAFRRIWELKGYLLAIAVIQAIDITLGRQISFWVPLLLPIGLATWNRGARFGSAVAVVGALALTLQGVFIGNPFTALGYLAFSAFSKATVMGLFVWLVGKLREHQVERVRIRQPSPSALGITRRSNLPGSNG